MELDALNTTKEVIAIKKEQEQKTELKYIGTIKPRKGHTLFKVCKKSGEITKAEFDQQDVFFEQAISKKQVERLAKKKKVIIDDSFFYISALNKKNVIKKLSK